VDDNIKRQLLVAINYEQEFDEVLGKGQGATRRCFNTSAHGAGDSTPSLSFNKQHGGWRCHGCGEKGDIFSLLMKKHGWDFPKALAYLLQKYNLWDKAGQEAKASKQTDGSGWKKFTLLQDQKELKRVEDSLQSLLAAKDKLEFMYVRYGLNLDTIRKYVLGWDKHPGSNRVIIPVWYQETGRHSNHSLRKIVNIRKHDAFRFYVYEWCKGEVRQRTRPDELTMASLARQEMHGWTPKWGQLGGKVISVKGHGGPYIYPMQVMYESPSVYVVGGEFKALLLNQIGIPAVCFTGGEGGVSEELLPLFIGKQVRVLLDVDKAGVDGTFGRAPGTNGPTDRGVLGLAQTLANYGAYVEAGRWPDDIVVELPEKGDVTDYIIKCDFKPEAMDFLQWERVERQEEDEKVDGVKVGGEPTEISWEEMKEIPFNDLVEPKGVEDWIRFPGLVSGRGEAPFVVPHSCEVTCAAGKKDVKPLCRECRLPSSGFANKVVFSVEKQLEMVGIPNHEMDSIVKQAVGIPARCKFPDINNVLSAVEHVILTPTVDNLGSSGDDKKDFEFAHRQAYLVSDSRIEIRENTTYQFGGQLLRDPKNGRFTVAVKKFRAAEGDILHFQRNEEREVLLRSVVANEDYSPADRVAHLVADLRDHVAHIYGQDEMLLAILLSFFLPFQFRLGDDFNERICPAVLVLGDTSVGKSTVTKRFVRHFGAGRFKTMDSKPTFVGLVGGNIPYGNRMAFSWGILPTSHRGWVGFDEFSKLPIEDIGTLTNTLSSGIAQRATANGDRQTLCNVRLLYLTNPRGTRPLRSLDPFEAALAVMGTVQDLGRVEYLHVQPELRDKSAFTRSHRPGGPQQYLREMARYHLSWTWSLTPDRILFVDTEDILLRAGLLSAKYGGNTLLLPAMARFKLARVAAGFAALLFSTDGYNLVVKKEHVDLAYSFFDHNYSKILRVSSASLPTAFATFLDKVPNARNLRVLLAVDKFTRDDLLELIDATAVKDFVRIGLVETGILAKQGPHFRFREETTRDRLAEYLANRAESDAPHHS
jgi:hypothetical protein